MVTKSVAFKKIPLGCDVFIKKIKMPNENIVVTGSCKIAFVERCGNWVTCEFLKDKKTHVIVGPSTHVKVGSK